MGYANQQWIADHPCISIKPGDNVKDIIQQFIDGERLVAGRDKIEEITISAHGYGGGFGNFDDKNGKGDNNVTDVTLQRLQETDSPQSQMLAVLRPYTQGNCTVNLNACKQADGPNGLALMQLMSNRLGAKVIGYDDWFSIWGRGNDTQPLQAQALRR